MLVNRLVVRFRAGVPRAAIQDLGDSLGVLVLREATSGSPNYWLTYPRGQDPLVIAAQLNDHPLVEWASPDRIGSMRPAHHVPTDGFYTNQYYLRNSVLRFLLPVDIAVENVWRVTKGSDQITVAVIGTGIDATHPELLGRRKDGPCFDGWDEAFQEPVVTGSAWEPWGVYDPPGPPYAEFADDHETAVAGIVAANHNAGSTAGIAPNVKLVSARIFFAGGGGSENTATNAQMADAIRWAWDFCEAHIVNGSFGGGDGDTDIATAIEDGAAQGRGGFLGTVFVFAGGNSTSRQQGNLYAVEFPASVGVSIAVGAINRWGDITDYSPYGGWPNCPPGAFCAPPSDDAKFRVDLVGLSSHWSGLSCGAPPDSLAAEVYTTSLAGAPTGYPFCNDAGSGYMRTFTGTSATAPQVAAAAALLLSLEPSLTHAQVKARLLDSADTWGPAVEYGAGKLNIQRALGITIPPIETVGINGSSHVRPSQWCTWTASVSGGTPPYSYAWHKDGNWIGSGQSVSLDTGGSNFTLRLDVEDAYHETAWTTKSVTVSSSGFECFS